MTTMRRRTLLAAGFVVALAGPAAAWDDPAAMAGFYRLGPAAAQGDACEIELLAAIAYEFEGIWYVARPLHYEDNRATCRAIGIADIIAWSGLAEEAVWLLAEGDAGFMEFTPDRGTWRLAASDHAALPEIVLSRMPAN